jgi:hypothetical protein
MKNKFYILLLLATLTLTITSCVTSRSKYGCPTNVR